VTLGLVIWAAAISALHVSLNVNPESVRGASRSGARLIRVGYIPVTCHLTCPVTDFISRRSQDDLLFVPKMFQGFPEIKEALIANRIQVAFMVAPMAIALRAQGVPLKVVYLGHRYGSAVTVRRDGPIRTVADLRGHTIAVPSRFSDERLMVVKALKVHHLSANDVRLVEMQPPDVAGALAVRAIDAFSMGEPFPSQAEIGGFGRILFHAREYWPDYMSCIVVVRQDLIDERQDAVQALVDGIARSGLWLDEGRPNREYAAEFVGLYYYRQPPRLLRWALTNPLDRVVYSSLSPRRADFELVQRLMIETGVLERLLPFEDYVDPRFAEGARDETPWRFGPGVDGRR